MKNYILVHGAWGAAWEFDKVVELLSVDGNRVIALDLPGHGNNKLPVNEVTMETYAQSVIDAISKFDEQVVLVGHSLAGAVISKVAEEIPQKIEHLIYVAAMLLKNGETPLFVMENDEEGELLANTIFSDDQTIATVSEATIRNILLNDIKDPTYLKELVPGFTMQQSTEPFMAVTQLSQVNFGSVPKSYIKASIDKVLSPKLQDEMTTNWPLEDVFTLESGHFPLTSMPDKLVDVIRQVSK